MGKRESKILFTIVGLIVQIVIQSKLSDKAIPASKNERPEGQPVSDETMAQEKHRLCGSTFRHMTLW